jgi:hypothetical protein
MLYTPENFGTILILKVFIFNCKPKLKEFDRHRSVNQFAIKLRLQI